MKQPRGIAAALLLGGLLLTPLGVSAEPTLGQQIGAAAREIHTEVREGGRRSVAFVRRTSRQVAREAQAAYREARRAGRELVHDIREGYGAPPAREAGPPPDGAAPGR